MVPAYSCECNSCDIRCEPPTVLEFSRRKTELEPKGSDYVDLLVDVDEVLNILARTKGSADVESDMDVADVVKLFAESKSFNKDVEKLYENYLKGIQCMEYLAVYCPSRDVVYYNVDRIARWVTRLYLANVGTFIKQIAKNLGGGMGGGQKLGIPFELVKNVAAKVTRDVSLTYLFNHERYHWAGGPAHGQKDEEAMATAFGLYKAYLQVIDTGDLRALTGASGARGRGGPGGHQGSGPTRLHVDASGMMSRDVLNFKNYVLSSALAAYFGHLTLTRIFFEHLHLPEYSRFVNYLSRSIEPPELLVESVPVGIGNETRLRVRSRGLESVTYRITTGSTSSVRVFLRTNREGHLEFKGNLRSRNRNLREKYKFCERMLSLEPDTWLIDTRLVIDGKYLKGD
ncbi:MAG: hypothetical protein ACP5HQ_03155 [Thermoprotei archaeon]